MVDRVLDPRPVAERLQQKSCVWAEDARAEDDERAKRLQQSLHALIAKVKQFCQECKGRNSQ